ncbi:50S ribosomal protein L19-1, chloroplastic isoform X1 [Sesamum indicum]|uniref:50S ribosomal protein L19-1, chloroplastic isoform X1 n=1 Tax=Sesamum indicum TaxID=4182 RepID=A0A6I9SPL6_SESIN|nr:50S ribosomal protein L19-1, chloroplastic isoform X1 [Sesamum indicum]XP_011071964.1 50S ribosomal protein L19-1, chloroplastic isoform X1 [Sesamum indicum]
MQSLYGKLRLVMKQMVDNVKNVERIVSFESKFLGCSMNQWSGFNSPQSCSSSAFFLESLLLQNKSFGTKVVLPASSKSYGIVSELPSLRGLSSCLNQSGPSVFTLATRNMTTGSTSQDVSASPDVPQRIKFKRLDKTARHIMQIIDKEAVEEVKTSREIPEIKPGYIVQLKLEVPENKRRVSVIKGIVIARRNAGLNTTFRIRRLVAGVGIESLFPLYSPNIKEIKVLDKKKVRRAKLYYLRDKMNALKKQ